MTAEQKNETLMKLKSLLFTAAMALTGVSAQAQYQIINSLPVPKVDKASAVSEYGFYANWEPVTDDPGDALGYYVRAYVAMQAKEDGQKFYLLNTDFSYLKSSGTEENPDNPISNSNTYVMSNLSAPQRSGWTTLNRVGVDGELCLNGAYNWIIANAAVMYAISDLSVGGGEVHFKFRIKGDGIAKNFTVQLRNTDTFPNEVLDRKDLELTTEWQDVEFVLKGGMVHSDILLMGNEMGNQDAMFYYIDDIQIWQELKKGEIARSLYSDTFVKDDIDAYHTYVSTYDLNENESFAYSVCTYNYDGISQESDIVYLDSNIKTGVKGITADGASAVDASTPVTVYNLQGAVVARGTAGNAPSLPSKGAYIVKTGDKVRKIVSK